MERSFLAVEGVLRVDRVVKFPSVPSRCLGTRWEGLLALESPVSIGPSFHLRKWGWVSLIRWGVGLFLLGPIEKKGLKRG